MAPYELIALLAACRASPADDMPRLVLADWLDEHGDEARASFLRIQVELSHPTANEKRTRELKRLVLDLLQANYENWLGTLHEIITPHDTRAHYIDAPLIPRPPNFHTAIDGKDDRGMAWWLNRGMIAFKITHDLINSSQLLTWMQSDQANWVDEVRIKFDDLTSFENCKHLHPYAGRLAVTIDANTHVRGHDSRGRPLMSTGESPTPQRWRQFVQSDAFAMLRSLKIQGINGLGFLRELAEMKAVPLVALSLDCRSNLHEAAEVAASTPFTALTSLELGGVDTRTLQILARSRNLRCLQTMNLLGHAIGDAGLIALCESDLAKSLHTVTLQNTGIGDAGIEALVKSPLFKRLTGPCLNLMMNNIGDAGMIALANSPELARFTELVMRENRVSDAGITAFAESPYTKQFTYVDFWRNRIGDDGARAIAASPNLDAIVDLCLKENKIEEAGRAVLIERFGEQVKL